MRLSIWLVPPWDLVSKQGIENCSLLGEKSEFL